MKNMFSLGNLYLNNFLKPGESPGDKHELKLIIDESCGAARLEKTVDTSKMFGKYWYRSGTNESMKAALKDVVDSILSLNENGVKEKNWLDIACNDGTLLSYVPAQYRRYGVDPCEKSIIEKARENCEWIRQGYFKRGIFTSGSFDVITTIAMFYDLADPDSFCKDVHEVMADDGLWVIQQSYSPIMIQQLAFDNICHEHVYYHTLGSMKTILERNGFSIVDCTLNDTNGGSFRLFVKKKGASFATQAYRDVCNMRMQSLLKMEQVITWNGFYERVIDLRETVRRFLIQAKRQGKIVMGYGASTKGNTLLQFFGLDNTLITAIADRQEKKWGLVTPGTYIPIISEEEMRKAKPDYLLVLPWQFIAHFREREREYLKSGGKMIVCNPLFQIIES